MGDYTQEAYERMKAMLAAHGDLPGESSPYVNPRLTTEERIELFNEIVGMIGDDEKPQVIAQQVVGIVNEFIEKKVSAANERKQGKSPIFRRVG